MNPVYIDIHIHTSENPNSLNESYNVDTLIEKVNQISKGADHLLCLTDHNTINKNAYIRMKKLTTNLLLGAELHIRNYSDKPAYHCHIIFNCDITESNIDMINQKLNGLYPDKVVTKDTNDIPTLDKVINEFDDEEFILLPHGGQSHSTFDRSISEGVKFDSTLERSIYYNQFDGFTARANNGLDETIKYFRRLGINEFVNLVTCTDNYNPNIYPEAKAQDASPFIPTWMLAKPTFNGLRLSLSESNRFIYSDVKPSCWSEKIEQAVLQNERVDMEVKFSPGLNVVIGGSSSGKTLLVDSVYNKLTNNFDQSKYKELGVETINIVNPSGIIPHYISQNYIIQVINESDNNIGIEDIELIKKVFPEDADEVHKLRNALSVLKEDLYLLIDSVKIIEEETKNILRIPVVGRLLVDSQIEKNLIKELIPSDSSRILFDQDDSYFDEYINDLEKLQDTMNKNPFAESINEEVNSIRIKIHLLQNKLNFEKAIRNILSNKTDEISSYLSCINREAQTKIKNYEDLIKSIANYIKAKRAFEEALSQIASYSFTTKTKEITSSGHKLSIENKFTLNKQIFVEVINKFLKTQFKIARFSDIQPEIFYESRFSKQSPKVNDYIDFILKVYAEFEKMNTRSYKIITRDGKDFNKLSAGWKTSVLLDLILGYEDDIAPLIIDQPEDNLATNYINTGLIESIKKIKIMKQIILVSHNATIPMLGDAQNIILCRNNNNRLLIRSSELEGEIDGKSMVDYIASITDGGKSSIKKRVKKYNLKKFRGENE